MAVDHWRTGTVDSTKWGELYSGIDKGPDDVLLEFLGAGGDPNLRPREFGATLLDAAAFKGRRHLVEALIRSGADIDALSGQGFTPLATAAHKGHAGCVRVLLAAGASVKCRPLGMSLIESLAYAQSKSEAVRELLGRGATDA
jgi:ankyrin repeat protein